MRQLVLLAAAAAMAAATAVMAQDYPSRPITLVVGFAPGGGSDILARLLVPVLSEELGVPVVVENRVGASGTIAAAGVARAEADGYTMLMGHVSSNAMVPAVIDVSYDPLVDFTPVMQVGSVPQVVTVPAASPAQSLSEFIALLKEKPGSFNYASSGIGTQQHLAAELFLLATGTEMTHIPYKGSGQAVNDLVAGVVDVNFDTMPTVISHIRSGTLRGLAVTTPERVAAMPDLPTVSEVGVVGYDVSAWYMVMGPAGLPQPIVAKWEAALTATLADPETQQRLVDLSIEIGGGTSAEARALLESDVARWADVVVEAGIEPIN